MKLLKKTRVLLVTAAAVLALAAGAQSALAYFTTYVTAKGGYTIRLGETTSLEESFANWTKRVRVSNTGSLPCYVRVRAFCGSRYTLTFTGEGWNEGADGCWYYNAIVPAGGASSELDIAIGNVPADEAESFNVIVVQEAAAVRYAADGTPYADWSQTLSSDSSSYDVKEAQ